MSIEISVIAASLLEVSAIWLAWRAISMARTSQGALGWVIFLIAFPFAAVPLFLFLGHHRYHHYVTARRDSEDTLLAIRAFGQKFAPDHPPAFPVTTLERISDLPVVRGNDMRLLVDGDQTFDALFAAIDAARDYILVQFYIVRDDATGRALHDRLVAAAGRGVGVYFLFDPIGSAGLSSSYVEALRMGGVRVLERRQMRGPKNRFQVNFRNHRKTVVVDGRAGFTGGLNVGDEYMGRSPVFGSWRDTHVQLTGPVVQQLQLVYVEDWHWATGEVLIDTLNWEPEAMPADLPALIVATGPGDRMETGALFFFTAIANARRRVWIASPYFVPDRDVLTALKHAALQGLDVRLLLPEVMDHRLPWLAAFAFFDEIRAAGVQIWRYNAGFMHQKVVLVDDTMTAVGTTNLDNRSFRLNFESMAVFFDPAPARAVENMLARDFGNAFELTQSLSQRPPSIRYGAPIARLFAPIL